MYNQLTNTSYNKAGITGDTIRVNDLFIDGDIIPSRNMASSRFNVPIDQPIQMISPLDPNPSYIRFS